MFSFISTNEDGDDVIDIANYMDIMQKVVWKTKEMSRKMEVSLDEKIRNAAGDIRKEIEELRKQKAKKTAEFTKTRGILLALLNKELPST